MAEALVKKNPGKILCEKCGSVILLENAAVWTEVPDGIFLPAMKTTDGEGAKGYEFWTVSDMFAFENVGFCNTVENIKYLACADCEIGPIGAHILSDKKTFYVSPLRVKHDVPSDGTDTVDDAQPAPCAE
ncbi:guanine nucleotide exchange factor MSS4-like [Clavelina lepadiformis]|uniref:guanine nucleotide exchange factor MSS4-like n=1 Tax=Clavelina lepadiformis TaxID=159417 RepID=UPI0040424246